MMDRSVFEQTDLWMNGGVDGWFDCWANVQMDKQIIFGQTVGWMDHSLAEQMDGYFNGNLVGMIVLSVYGWMDGLLSGQVNKQTWFLVWID